MLAPEGLKGVIPAIPTPFTADGASIDESALRRVVRHVIEGGVHGIMTTGGTGEFPHLSRDERRRVTEIVVSETAGAVPVYAGTAACATWEAIALTEDAATAGADAAILTPPFYFRIPEEMLLRHFEEVAGAGILPVVVYNNPLYTGNDLGPGLIAALMGVDNVIGLKQSNDDLGQLVEALRLSEGSGRSLLTGIDSQFYAALSVGARGIFSTAAAIVPAEMVRLYDLVASGDHAAAAEQHRRLQPLNRFLEYDPGYVSPTKEALTMLGSRLRPGPPAAARLPRVRTLGAARSARDARRRSAGGVSVRLATFEAGAEACSRGRRRRDGRRPPGGLRALPRRGRGRPAGARGRGGADPWGHDGLHRRPDPSLRAAEEAVAFSANRAPHQRPSTRWTRCGCWRRSCRP